MPDDARIAKLRELGLSDEEIASVFAEEEEVQEPRSPRSVSEWKRKARTEEAARVEAEGKLAVYERREEFDTLVAQVPEDVRSFVSFEDIKDEPKLTPALLKVKAQEKMEVQAAAKADQAKTLGFPDVASYDAAMQSLAAQAAQAAQQQQGNTEKVAAQAAVTLGAPPPIPNVGVRQEARQAAEQGDLEKVKELVFGNPGSFKRPLGEDFRPN
jgi:hypothetical protein